MRSILRLASHILGNGEDRSALAKRIEALEKENDEIRGENDRLREENEAMLYEHMVRGQGQAFREVKARFKAIYEAARREMDIIGSDPHDNRTLNALDRIKNIACGSVKVEPESK
jgi:cell division protein FtsB